MIFFFKYTSHKKKTLKKGNFMEILLAQSIIIINLVIRKEKLTEKENFYFGFGFGRTKLSSRTGNLKIERKIES